MFENKNLLINELRSPLNISILALNEIQSRLEGNSIIADPNSPFCHLLEFGSSLASNVIQTIDEKFPALYPYRAMTVEELYKHMSDYDFLRIYSTPAQTTIRLMLPKKYLRTYALDYNDYYKKVSIPSSAIFTIGKYRFGIYYPIDIMISKSTGIFTVKYDTSKTNRLHSLTKNLIDTYNIVYNSLDYIVLEFPIYQFAKATVEDAIVSQTGYVKKLVFNNKFYALKVFSYKNGEYTELKYTQSYDIYDVDQPTVNFQVLQDSQELKLFIPQVYFDNNMLGSKLLIEVYTTMGDIEISTANIPASTITYNFVLKSKDTTEYSGIFKNLPFEMPIMLVSDSITGGSDATNLRDLREAIINDALYESVPITDSELQFMLSKNGFTVKKYLDNVTDRTYFAYHTLEDVSGNIIPSLTSTLMLKQNNDGSYTDNPFVLHNSDGSLMISPSVIFVKDELTGSMRLQTKQELYDYLVLANTVKAFQNTVVDRTPLLEYWNQNRYFKTPFYIKLYSELECPVVTSYNLTAPEIKRVIFDAENYELTPMMTCFDATIVYAENDVVNSMYVTADTDSDASMVKFDKVTGKFTIQMSLGYTEDLSKIDFENTDDVIVYICTKTAGKDWVSLVDSDSKVQPAKFVRQISQTSRVVYQFEIDTNLFIDASDNIGVTNFKIPGQNTLYNEIPLSTDWFIVTMVRKSLVVNGAFLANPQELVAGVETDILEEYVAMGRQHLTLELGHNLKDVLHSNIEISTKETQYELYEKDEGEEVYKTTVYATDEQGNYIWQINPETNLPELVVLHKEGDPTGQVLHKAGDVKLDSYGTPIVKIKKGITYYIDNIFLDAKLYASEQTADQEYARSIPSIFEGYFKLIRNAQSSLLERTGLYFKCVKSTGTAQFNLGNNIISTQSIEMSFEINCYVPSHVGDDAEAQASIKSKICTAVEKAIQNRTISMMDIFSEIKESMPDFIDHFTLLGINNDIANQTFSIIDEDVKPSLCKKLILNEDNLLQLEKQLIVHFIVLDSNVVDTENIETSS